MTSLWMRLLGWQSSVANTTGGCRHLGARGATETPSNTSMTRSPPAGRLSSDLSQRSALVGKGGMHHYRRTVESITVGDRFSVNNTRLQVAERLRVLRYRRF